MRHLYSGVQNTSLQSFIIILSFDLCVVLMDGLKLHGGRCDGGLSLKCALNYDDPI